LTLSTDFHNADNLLSTLTGGKLKALVKDNKISKTYNLCIVVSTENDYETTHFKMTYELYCDGTNHIKVDPSFATNMTSPASIKPEHGFYVFDPSNLITTSFAGCPITDYEISP
jgi:hypothetical protein